MDKIVPDAVAVHQAFNLLSGESADQSERKTVLPQNIQNIRDIYSLAARDDALIARAIDTAGLKSRHSNQIIQTRIQCHGIDHNRKPPDLTDG